MQVTVSCLGPCQISMMDLFAKIVNPLTTNAPHYINTSQLICIADQLTGFYMMGNTGC